jgi:hypothetical protein
MTRSMTSAKKILKSYPISFGVLLSILFAAAIVLVDLWFPWVFDYHDRHKRLVQAILFTTIYFVVYAYGLRRYRTNAAFWPTIVLALLVHGAGVFLYSAYVGPILVWQWPILGLLEYCAIAYLLGGWRSYRSNKVQDTPRAVE